MTATTRRERHRAATESEIRDQARVLVVREGWQAVSLRGIARELGMTAPALYRYYESRDELFGQVRQDICADLDRALRAPLAGVPDDDHDERVLAVCRAFRTWSLAHPQEFGLVFAASDDFGRDQVESVFLGVVGELLHGGLDDAAGWPEPPAELIPDLRATRRSIVDVLAAAGRDLDDDDVSLAAVHWVLQWWIRLYGHVALEVFDRFPFEPSGAERMFESMLGELACDTGATRATSDSGATRDSSVTGE